MDRENQIDLGLTPEVAEQKPSAERLKMRPVDFSLGGNVVIRVEELWKQYRLGAINHGTLANDLQSWWARIRGQEDPNARLGGMHGQGALPTAGAQDRFWALRDISFDVMQGEVLGIIGRNGAGKSTLLKIFSKVTTPSRGQVLLKGRVASLLEVGTGFHPELTGRENVFLNGAILGMTKAEVIQKFDEIVAFAEVEKFIDTPVKRYSSGMYVRLAFAVAAHLEPEILVVDEVLAVGDVAFQKKCLGKMKDIAAGGRTVLFVSHNMSAVNNLCDKCALLQNGELTAVLPAREAVERYLFSDIDQENTVCFEQELDKRGQFKELSIRNQKGVAVREMTCEDSFAIRIVYEVREVVPGLVLTCYLKNAEGQIVFFTDSRDVQPCPSYDLKVGKHQFLLQVQGRLLAPTNYIVSVGSAIGSKQEDKREDVLDFRLTDIDSPRGDKRPGCLSIRIPWVVTENQ
ncbi:ABC transporter ATP-binding protein [Trichloromonas sp.]|uniref:ABC transporter ATP-binding protein n=1 Tax=Trichloromonas sp. TaxID=3069249 RepID=UPI003D8185F5